MSKFKKGDKVVCTAKERPFYFNWSGLMDYVLNEGAVLEVVSKDWEDDYTVINPKDPYRKKWCIAEEHLKLYEEEGQGDLFSESLNIMVKEELKKILKEVLDKLQ